MPCRRIIYALLTLSALLLLGVGRVCAQFHPVHASVVWASPRTPYLPDFYSGSRDRLVVTLTNRDATQPVLHVRMRVCIRCVTGELRSREELPYPHIVLSTGIPHRITNADLAAYLQPDRLTNAHILRNGQLPDGFTEISVQAVDLFTGKALSDWHTARGHLSVNKPPFLIAPEKDATVALTEPTAILFRWQPRLATATEYEFTLKELPSTGESPQGAFPYGHVVHRETVRGTMLSYTHLHPPLIANRLYAWQIRAIQRDGIDEVSTYENGGYSEVSWFRLTDGCAAPTHLHAHTRYAKVELRWRDAPKVASYTIQIRPKTRLGIYEWQAFSNVSSPNTIRGLLPGRTYEWRVGASCTDIEPVYSEAQEFTLSTENEELLRDCGKVPEIPKGVSQEPHLAIEVGDVVTVGGDYPLTITEIEPLGDGWYAGRGRTQLRAIMYIPLAMRFDSLRINVDYRQIGGAVEAMTRDDAPNILNTDLIDDGGSTLLQGQPIVSIVPLGFALPSVPQFTFNPQTLELQVLDSNGAPQFIPLQIPQNAPLSHVFPMQVRDSEGNVFAISPENEVNIDAKGAKDIKLHAQRIERVGGFDPTQMAKGLGQVTFRPHAQGRYAFDWGTWEWYRRSVKLDPYYTPFAPNYIAPWKLVPCGETDYVTACFEGDYKKIDVNKIRFATAPDGDALEAVYDPKILGWRISLHATEHGHTYNIYALYKGQVIGKLRVVSYRAQHHTVTIVPVNNAQPDTAAIERRLNGIYNPVGVSFTVRLDERMRGNVSWSAAGDGRLSLVGLDLFGNEAERRESPDMRRLQAAYAQAVGGLPAGSGCYLFVLDGESGLDPTSHLLGEMPRRSRFGYLFSPDGRGMERTIAHELGHGLFTLQHTFDSEYGGRKSEAKTANLMDYAGGTELAAFQWNIMASPAVFTLLDDGEDGQIRRILVAPYLFTLRTFHNLHKPISIEHSSGELDLSEHLFAYKFQNRVFVHYATERMQVQNGAWILPNITFSKQSKHSKFHNATFYQVIISDVGEINCLSEKDRDMIYSYLTGQNDAPIFDPHEVLIHDNKYSFALMYKQLEQQKRELISSGKYQELSAEERIILDLPLIMWLKQWYYGSIFMYNWIVGEGDIVMDDKMFEFIDGWKELQELEKPFMSFINRMLNKKITAPVKDGSSKLYELFDIKGIIAKNSLDEMKIDSLFDTKYTNFSNYSLTTSVTDVINTPYIAAFGSFTKMFLFTGVAYKSKHEIAVDGIWEYYNDGFNFIDKDYGDDRLGKAIEYIVPSQLLGNWHSSIFKSDVKVGRLPSPLKGQHYLQNKDFNSFREKTGVGKDFRITGKRLHKDKFISTIKLYEDGVVYK